MSSKQERSQNSIFATSSSSEQSDSENDELSTIEPPQYFCSSGERGVIDFHKVVKKKYYIDKTLFIDDVLAKDERGIAIFRCRNSFKTTNLKAVQSYCDYEDSTRICFDTLKINTNKKYFGQYCAIRIAFDAVRGNKSDNYEDVMKKIREIILISLRIYLKQHDVSDEDLESMNKKFESTEDLELFHEICYRVQRKFDRKVILLMDDIDKPFLIFNSEITKEVFHSLMTSFFDDYSISNFKTIMMGSIVPKCFLKNSSFGGKIRLDLGERKSIGFKHFMFNEEEVIELCQRYGLSVDITLPYLKKSYGGYSRIDEVLYEFNAFSIVRFFDNELGIDTTEILWNYFHSMDVLHASDKISACERDVWWKICDSNKAIFEFHEVHDIDYEDFLDNVDMGFMFLIMGGYLTVVKRKKHGRIEVKIPNEEILSIFLERKENLRHKAYNLPQPFIK